MKCSHSSIYLPCGGSRASLKSMGHQRPFSAVQRTWQRAVATASRSRGGDYGSSSSSGGSLLSSSDMGDPGSGSKEQAVVAAARQRLQAYLQQQWGISQTEAAQLAERLSERLGAVSRQLFDSYQPAAFQLPAFQLAPYQQWCKDKQQDAKGSQPMAVVLSKRQRRKMHARLRKVALLQRQLGLTAAEAERLLARVHGSFKTIAAGIQWLLSFADSKESAVSMLRVTPALLNFVTTTLDSKIAKLQAAWADKLQPGQLRRLVHRAPQVFERSADQYSPTAAALQGWFPQCEELLAVLDKAPALLATSATALQATERWLTGAPLSLSRQRFLSLVQASPQTFYMNLAGANIQHKLAFVNQVGGVPLSRALSRNQLVYLMHSLTALAGRYFLLVEHGVEVPRHEDGGIRLGYSAWGLPRLLRFMRQHGGEGRLPADDDAALAYLQQWLDAWPETESGQQWAKPPAASPKP